MVSAAAAFGLGPSHEGQQQVVHGSNFFADIFEGEGLIGHFEGVFVLPVNLILAREEFMV